MQTTFTLGKRKTHDGVKHNQENLGKGENQPQVSRTNCLWSHYQWSHIMQANKAPEDLIPRPSTLTEDTNDTEHIVTDGETHDGPVKHNKLV